MTAVVAWTGLRNGRLVARYVNQAGAESALANGWVDSIASDDWAARAAERRCQERADRVSLKQQQIVQRKEAV